MLTSGRLFEFRRAGEDLFRQGCNNSHSGNMSIREGGSILITRTGAQLGRLGWDDLVETAFHYEDAAVRRASMELVVHRAIYGGTPATAIIHAHPPHAVALSFGLEAIRPVDAEGRYYMPEVPVLAVNQAISSAEVAAALPALLRRSPVVVVRGHGSFAAAPTLERCLLLTSSLENACKVMFLASVAGGAAGRMQP